MVLLYIVCDRVRCRTIPTQLISYFGWSGLHCKQNCAVVLIGDLCIRVPCVYIMIYAVCLYTLFFELLSVSPGCFIALLRWGFDVFWVAYQYFINWFGIFLTTKNDFQIFWGEDDLFMKNIFLKYVFQCKTISGKTEFYNAVSLLDFVWV